tara:strand:+ start:876 stop:2846 length:1971 start_codon:yes stop_codon:yes gene_type:complete
MKKFIYLITIFLLFNNQTYSQEILVDDFTNQIIHENFQNSTDIFPIQKSGENYFVIDNNEYLVIRNQQNSEYAIMLETDIISNLFIKSSIRIGPSNNKSASVGIIIKADNNFNRAIIFEVNKKGEYRIKELNKDKYVYLSGKSRKNGWVRNRSINKVDLYNEIQVRNKKNQLNFIINETIVATLEIKRYSKGFCGLLIGPDTKARISYFYLNSNGKEKVITNGLNIDNLENNKNISDSQNTQKIVKLKEQNTKLSVELKEKENKISDIKKSKAELESKISILESNNNTLNTDRKANEEKLTVIKKFKIELESKISIIEGDNNSLKTVLKENELFFAQALENQKLILKEKEKSSETELNTLKNQLNNQQKISNGLKEKNNEFSTEIKLQSSKLNKLSVSIKKSNSNLELKNIEKSKLEIEISEINLNYDKSLKSIATKNNEIKNLKNKIVEITTSLNSLKKKLNEKENLYDTSKKELGKLIINYKKNIDNKTADILSLENKLEKNNNTIKTNSLVISNIQNKMTKLNKINSDNKTEIINQKLSIDNQKNINNNLKEIFVYKDFELNGVIPSTLIAEKVGYPPAKEIIRTDSIYSVQLGVFQSPNNKFNDINNIWIISSNNTFKYYCGEFNSLNEAKSKREKLITLGFKNIFINKLLK